MKLRWCQMKQSQNSPRNGIISTKSSVKIKHVAILKDWYCEKLARPCLFPIGRFDYKIRRDALLYTVKDFNQHLLN